MGKNQKKNEESLKRLICREQKGHTAEFLSAKACSAPDSYQ